MAVFKYLKTLIRKNPNPKNPMSVISLFHSSAIQSPLPFPIFSPSPLLSSPFRRPLFPFSGPLFLSSPPSKLLQSATPLFPRNGRNPRHLLPNSTFNIKLGFSPVSPLQYAVPVVHRTPLGDNCGRIGGADGFLNLPNLISLSRMVSGPFLGWMIMNEWYVSSFVGLAVSGATDWLDGVVARKMGINSVIGSYLDPVADKVLIGCVAVAMVKMDLLHSGLVGLVVFRDAALISGAVYKRASSLGWKWKSWSDFFNLDRMHPVKVEPLFISKVNTVFQLILVAAALLQPDFGTSETQSYITYLSWLVASTTVASSVAYGAQHMKSSVAASKALQSISRSKPQ